MKAESELTSELEVSEKSNVDLRNELETVQLKINQQTTENIRNIQNIEQKNALLLHEIRTDINDTNNNKLQNIKISHREEITILKSKQDTLMNELRDINDGNANEYREEMIILESKQETLMDDLRDINAKQVQDMVATHRQEITKKETLMNELRDINAKQVQDMVATHRQEITALESKHVIAWERSQKRILELKNDIDQSQTIRKNDKQKYRKELSKSEQNRTNSLKTSQLILEETLVPFQFKIQTLEAEHKEEKEQYLYIISTFDNKEKEQVRIQANAVPQNVVCNYR